MRPIATLLFIACFFIAKIVTGQTNSFLGYANDQWNEPKNWSLKHVPTSTENVLINASFSVEISPGVNAVARNLTLQGELLVDEYAELLAEQISVESTGELKNLGRISIEGTYASYINGINSSGIVQIGAGATLLIDNIGASAISVQAGSFENQGSVEIRGSESGLSVSGRFTNDSGSSLVIEQGIEQNAIIVSGELINSGTISCVAGSGYNAVSCAGSFENRATGEMTLSGGNKSIYLYGSGDLANNGVINVRNGERIELNQQSQLTNGPGGMIQMDAPGSNTITGVELLSAGARLDNYGDIVITAPFPSGCKLDNGAQFYNHPGALLDINSNANGIGLLIWNGHFLNQGGVVKLNMGQTALQINNSSVGEYVNSNCGITNFNGGDVKVISGKLENSAIIWFRDAGATVTSNGTFDNTGIIGDRYDVLDGVPIQNHRVIVDPMDPPVMANTSNLNALELGGLSGITNISWRTSQNGPVAGIYQQAQNSFVPNNTAVGDDLLHVRMKLGSCPNKWFIVPIPGGVQPYVQPLPAPSGWERQHPFTVLEDILDVAFNDAGDGIAISQEGYFWLTRDFGDSWDLGGQLMNGHDLHAVRFSPVPGSQVAYLVSNTRIFRSNDAGRNWIQVNDRGGKHIDVFSDDDLIVSSSTLLSRSLDGGVSWAELSGPGESISSIQFLDDQTALVGGQNGGIYRTLDGALNWEVLNDTLFNEAVVLRFFDQDNGYAAIRRALAKTSDGGKSWAIVNPNAFGSNVSDMELLGNEHFVVSQGNRTFYSKDGGTTIQLVRNVQWMDDIRGVTVDTRGAVWATGAYSSIYRSLDGGESYSDQVEGNKNSLRAIDLVDPLHGWAVGNDFTVLKTSDGGQDWRDLSLPDSNWNTIRDISAVSPNELWVAGRGFLVKTEDGGSSWQELAPVPGDVNDVEIVGGAVFTSHVNGRVYRSVDGGQSWEYGEVLPNTTLTVLSFPTEQTGYVIGMLGLIAKTSDRGDNWSILDFPVKNNLLTVYFSDDDNGWVSVSKFTDTIYHTVNGGATWEAIRMPRNSFWNRIHFIDDSRGYAIGGSAGAGIVLATTDGGVTWEELHQSDQTFFGFDLVPTATDVKLWVCGPGGLIDHGTDDVLISGYEKYSVESLALFPNPSDGVVQLSDVVNGTITVHDIYGRICWQANGEHNALDLSFLPSGSYIIRCRTASDVVLMGRLIIQQR